MTVMGATRHTRPLDGSLTWRIAWRYLRGQRSQILSSTALAALVATTLGVTAMVIAMALMTGYTQDLQRKLIGLQGELSLSPLDPGALDDDSLVERLTRIPGVARVVRVAYGEGAISSTAVPEGIGVTLRGVDPEGDAALERLAPGTQGAPTLAPDASGLPGVLMGQGLIRDLGARPGETLRLSVLGHGEDRRIRFRYRSVRLAGQFETGFAEFDNRWILIDRGILAAARGPRQLGLLEVDLVDPDDTETVAEEVEALLGADWIVQRWYHLNRELFAALELQKTMLFLVLGLIVLVSTFNVASALVILVRERLTDVGVLSALGLPPAALWRIFTFYGLGLGTVGTALGVLLGGGISWTITEYELVRFDPELAAIYFIDSVPFRLEIGDLAAIIVFTLLVTLAACALPALGAARIRPSAALRAE